MNTKEGADLICQKTKNEGWSNLSEIKQRQVIRCLLEMNRSVLEHILDKLESE